jgi:hypothetical protein
MEIAFSPGEVVRRGAVSDHIGQDVPREYGRAAHTEVGLAKR